MIFRVYENGANARLMRRLQQESINIEIEIAMDSSFYENYFELVLETDTDDESEDSLNEDFVNSFELNFLTEIDIYLGSTDSVSNAVLEDFSKSDALTSSDTNDINKTDTDTNVNSNSSAVGSGDASNDDGDSAYVKLTDFESLGEAVVAGLESDVATQVLFGLACVGFSLIIFGMIHNCVTGNDSFNLWAIFFYALLTWYAFLCFIFVCCLYQFCIHLICAQS